MIKRTEADYIRELSIKNPNLELIGNYTKLKDKTAHHCKKHDYTWETTPERALKGVGCPKCAVEKYSKATIKSHEAYVCELSEKNPTVFPLETYVSYTTPILHKCILHNVEWKTTPASVLQGCGCNECGSEKASMKLKKTDAQYKEQLSNKNPSIVAEEPYIDALTPILHRCLIDNYKWKASPANTLSGTGCPLCAGNKRLSHEQYVQRLSIANPNLEVVGNYVNQTTRISHKCKKHNVVWDVCPVSALRGAGCKICCSEKISNSLSKSDDEYLSSLASINPKIIPRQNYNGANTPIQHQCLIDGFTWETTPNNILQGHGCPICSNNLKKTSDEYAEILKNINSPLEPLGDYINSHTPIRHQCKIHKCVISTSPASAIRGGGCRMCGAEKLSEQLTWTTEEYEMQLAVVNPDIKLVEEYAGANTPILHRCLLDGHEWRAYPAAVIRGAGCPQCNESKGERIIRQWLEAHKIQYIFQKKFKECKDMRMLPFDFYLPDNNCCIEYDGLQHYEPKEFFGGTEDFLLRQKHDNIKNLFCQNNGIRLIRISYDMDIHENLKELLLA